MQIPQMPLEGAAKKQDLQRHSGGLGRVGRPFPLHLLSNHFPYTHQYIHLKMEQPHHFV